MKKLLSILGLILISFNSFSQKVENVDFNFVDEKIVIFYDLVDCKGSYSYDIDIKFVDEFDKIITPRVLEGDYKMVTCGQNKRVNWNPFQELSDFQGSYKVVVSIVNVYNRYGRIVDKDFTPGNNSLALSLIGIVPGIKYHFAKSYGIYSCFNYIGDVSVFSIGGSKRIGKKLNYYLGTGIQFQKYDLDNGVVFEGGLLIKSKKMVYDIGILHSTAIDLPILPRIGIGFHF